MRLFVTREVYLVEDGDSFRHASDERRFTRYGLLGDDAGAGRLHLEDLNGVVHTFGRMIENETGIGNVGVEQLVLPAAEIDVAIINRTILVDVVVERQLGFAELLPFYQDIIRRYAHSISSAAHYNKVGYRRKPFPLESRAGPAQ